MLYKLPQQNSASSPQFVIKHSYTSNLEVRRNMYKCRVFLKAATGEQLQMMTVVIILQHSD